VTIRSRFQWHSIPDDWKTRHLKVAPISPSLALASMDRQFPVEFSKPVHDFGIFTPSGPYMAVENVDTFDATFKVLQYVNETEAYDPPQLTNHPAVQGALDRLRKTAFETFSQSAKFLRDRESREHQGLAGALWYPKGLPYYDATIRTQALATLREFFHEHLFTTGLYQLPPG